MTKEKAVGVVERLLPFCAHFIISIPIVKWIKPAFNGNPHEEQIKDDWSNEEVVSTFPNITHYFKGDKVGAYVLPGGQCKAGSGHSP